jgi:outer membrane protein OmpA-like peptidoglycan-associated protein
MKNTAIFLILMSCTLTINAQQTASKSSEDDLDAVISDLENNKPVKDRRVRLRNIQFLTGKALFSTEDRAYLDTIAVFLIKAPTITMEIGGYTDNVGSDKINNRLSQTRADAIKNYLVKERRITASRLRAVGYGKRNPLTTNETEEGRYMNRRVELKVLGMTNDVYHIVTKDGKRIPVNYVVTGKDNKMVSYRENENAPLVRVPAASIDYIEYPDGTRRQVGSVIVMDQQGAPAMIAEEPAKELKHSGNDWMHGKKVTSSKVGDWFSGRFPKIGRWSAMVNAGVMPLTVKQAAIDFAYVDNSPSKDNLRNKIDLKQAGLAPGGQLGFDFATDNFLLLRTQYQFARSSQAGFSGFLAGVGKGFGKEGRFSANLDVTFGSAFLKLGDLVQNDLFIQVNESRFYSEKVRIKFRNYFAALTPQISYDFNIAKGMSLRLAAGYSYSFNTKSSIIFKGEDDREKRVKGREKLTAPNVNFKVDGVRQTDVNLFRLQGPYATVGFLYHLYAR